MNGETLKEHLPM